MLSCMLRAFMLIASKILFLERLQTQELQPATHLTSFTLLAQPKSLVFQLQPNTAFFTTQSVIRKTNFTYLPISSATATSTFRRQQKSQPLFSTLTSQQSKWHKEAEFYNKNFFWKMKEDPWQSIQFLKAKPLDFISFELDLNKK